MKRSLGRVVLWGHELIAEVVSSGDRVVDLTAGRGQDALALWKMIGPEGQLIVFDVQQQAIDQTADRLLEVGAEIRKHEAPGTFVTSQPGVDLVLSCHSRYEQIIPGEVAAVVANLGYLPGGDQQLITMPQTTLAALKQAARSLRPGGRMAVVVYHGHVGGKDEADAVTEFFADLSCERFEVISLQVYNRPQAPYLLLAEKREKNQEGI